MTYDVYDMILESGMQNEFIDYTEIAMASLLETLEQYNKLEAYELIKESEWVQECIASGFVLPIMVPLFEADGDAPAEGGDAQQDTGQRTAKGWKLGDMTNAIKTWMDNITLKINQMVIKRSRKYVPWVDDVGNMLKDAANKFPPGQNVKLTPYYNGDWKGDARVCVDAINKLVRSMEAKAFDDFSYASKIVEPTDVAERSGTLSLFIKNYFRYGVKNTNQINSEVLDGKDLHDKYIDMMVEYLTSYEKTITSNINTISKAYNANKVSNALKDAGAKAPKKVEKEKPADTKESYFYPSPDMKLSIEDGRPISETILTTLMNYNALLEGPRNVEYRAPAGAKAKTKAQLDAEHNEAKEKEDKDPRVAKLTQQQIDGEEGGSTTKVETVGDDGKPAETNSEESEGGASNSAVDDYVRCAEYFVKLLITGYATACDERFITYLNTLKVVAKYGKVPLPKFDKNGNYISNKSVGKVVSNVKEGPRKTSSDDNATETKKSKGGVRKAVSGAVNRARSAINKATAPKE